MNQVQQQQWEELLGEEFHDLHDLNDLHSFHLQLSIHDSCKDAYRKTATRWVKKSDLLLTFCWTADLLCPKDQLNLTDNLLSTTRSANNTHLNVSTAIQPGAWLMFVVLMMLVVFLWLCWVSLLC